jgi:cell shape-determining protein MreC
MEETKQQTHDKVVAFAGYCEGVKFLSSTIVKLLNNEVLEPEERIKGVVKFCEDLEKINKEKEEDNKDV